MIFGIDFDVINVNDDIQISISKNTLVGQRIVREPGEGRTTDEAGNALHETHPTHNFLVSTDNNYFLLEGSVKVRYEWSDGDGFSDANVDAFKTVAEQHPEHARSNPEFGSGYMQGIAVLGTTSCDWKTSPVSYEPDNSKTILEIMEDDTRILCPMQYEKGWNFKKADVADGASITATKEGTNCYIVFGQDCTVDSAAVDKNSVKKLTSDSVSIENNSGKLCRLVKIYK